LVYFSLILRFWLCIVIKPYRPQTRFPRALCPAVKLQLLVQFAACTSSDFILRSPVLIRHPSLTLSNSILPMYLSACLITVLGLVSVASRAVPLSDTLNRRGKGTFRFQITFLHQNNPLMSIDKPRGEIGHSPQLVQSFFDSIDIIRALGYTDERSMKNRIVLDFRTQDPHYEEIIDKKLPVFLGFSGGKIQKPGNKGVCDGPSHTQHPGCLVIVGGSPDSPYGMIAKSGEFVGQVGNPAIVSFTNWQSQESPREPDRGTPDYLARQMVDTFLTHEEVIKGLEFTATPKIIHVDSFPHIEHDSKVDFQLYGGAKCSWEPCLGSVWFNHDAKPEPEYQGEVYQQGQSNKPILEWKMPIKGGAKLQQEVSQEMEIMDEWKHLVGNLKQA